MKQYWIPGLAVLALGAPLFAQNPALPAGAQGGYFPVQDALTQWRAAHGESWRVAYDDHAQFARMLYGGAARSAYRPQSDADFFSLARAAIAQSKSIHGVDTAELVEDSVIFLPLSHAGSTDKVTVQFRQSKNGVRVLEGFANVLFDLDGRVLSIDTTAARDIGRVSTTPLVSAERAAQLAIDWFADDVGVAPTFVSEPELLIDQPIVGKFKTGTLAWQVNVQHTSEGFAEGFYYRVDAGNGSQSSRARSVHSDVGGNVQSLATPGHAPDSATNPPVSQAMPFLRVTSASGNATTDAAGNFNIVGASAPLSVTVRYQGTWATVNNSAGASYQKVQTLNTASGNSIVMNSPAVATVTSQANAFLWINNLRSWTKSLNPADTAGDFVAIGNVNIASSCNAYYDGASTNYYLPGGGCPNMAYSSVVLHEMGHWYNDRYSSGNGFDGFGEGNADSFSMYVLDDPVIAIDFFGPGQDLRTGLNTTPFCGDCCNGCQGEPHASGEVLMGALWKVRARLKNTLGQSAGSQTADAIFSAWMNTYNDTEIKTIIETHWLTLDDDNGNISDGTPNYSDIDGGFRDQGFPGFGLTFVQITGVTQIPNSLATGPFTVNANATATFSPPVTSMAVKWRLNGAPSFQTVPMINTSGNSWTGDIPAQVCPSEVEYYVTGIDNNGQSGAFPGNAPTSVLDFLVAQETFAFLTDFEGVVTGWTHGQTSGGDDWQVSSAFGVNISAGEAGDPTVPAVGGTSVWGQDLGVGAANDGDYNDNQTEWLRSPFINCTGVSGAKLRFNRWLTCETGVYDHAQVRVNNVLVWQNVSSGNHIDTAWVPMELDISAIADNNPSVQIEFRMSTDVSVVFGGWNVDDVAIVTLSCNSNCNTPQNYCVGKVNTNGDTPFISFTGTPSFAAGSFTVDLYNGTFNKNGLVFWGSGAASTPFNGGTLCVQPPLIRGPALTTDGFGFASTPISITAGMVGTTQYYQYWMRDPGDAFGIGMSDALQVDFCD